MRDRGNSYSLVTEDDKWSLFSLSFHSTCFWVFFNQTILLEHGLLIPAQLQVAPAAGQLLHVCELVGMYVIFICGFFFFCVCVSWFLNGDPCVWT